MRKVQFDKFELDLELFVLTKNGTKVDMGQRTTDLLICLVENRDHIVDFDFLRTEVWKSAALSVATIPTCIRELRLALGDDSRNPRFVKSTRGRGYRFICEISNVRGNRHSGLKPVAELPFSGRRREIARIRSCIMSTIAEARGHVILIRGEAGIGKSRLLNEFLNSISTRVDYFKANISTTEGTPPLWPWTQILREAVDREGGNNPELESYARDLSSVFPEIIETTMPTSPAPPKLDRFSVLVQWVRTIRSIARSRPLLLVFEDIHRADIESLALLLRVSEELALDPIIIIATHRPPSTVNEVSRLISKIGTVRHAVSVDLTPLSEKNIWEMLDPLTENRDRVSKAIASRTLGNAFYVTHLIRYLDSKSTETSAEYLMLNIPLEGGQIVSRQLSDLPRAASEALAIASIAGEKFTIDILSNVLEISSTELITRLEPAVRAWLIRENGNEYSFCHSLLRDALYQTNSSSTRRTIHLRLSSELRNRSGIHENSASISDHLALAAPLAVPGDIHQFAMQAGREAAARFAFSRAKTFFERAYKATLDDSDCSPSDRCEVMQELARAMLYDGDRIGARNLLLEAIRFARNIDASSIFASCVLDLVPDFLSIEVGLYDSALVSLLEEALSLTSAFDLSLQAKLFARLAQAKQWDAALASSEGLANESLRLARVSGDSESLIAALSARADSLHGPDRVDYRLEVIAELGVVARRAGVIPAILLQQTRMLSALLELGDIKSLEFENEQYRNTAVETGLPQYKWYPGATDTMLAMMRGDISLADTLAREYKRSAGESPDQNLVQTYACQHVVRELERDNANDMVPFVNGFAAQKRAVYSWSAALTWLFWDSGQESRALESMRRFDRSAICAMHHEAGGGIGLATLSEVIAHLGTRDEAAYMYDLIAPLSNRCATAGYGIAYFGSFARYAGILALAMSNTDTAIDHLRHAIQDEQKRGARSWYAYAQIDLLRAYNQAGIESSKATDVIGEIQREIVNTELPLPRVDRLLAEYMVSSTSHE